MSGCKGKVKLRISLCDTSKYVTDYAVHDFFIFEKLNHKLIVGRDLSAKLMKRFMTYPHIDTILFDPSLQKVRLYNKRAFSNDALKTISGKVHSIEPIVTKPSVKSSKEK